MIESLAKLHQSIKFENSANDKSKICLSCKVLQNVVVTIVKIALNVFEFPWLIPTYSHQIFSNLTHSNITFPTSPKKEAIWWKRLGPFTPISGIEQSEIKRQVVALQITKLYAKRVRTLPSEHPVVKKPVLGFINWVPGNFSLKMPGVAVIAAYLSARRDLKGLFVCETIEAFIAKMTEINNSPDDQRCAFILPVLMSGIQKNGHHIVPNFPQHKSTVVVEKFNGIMKIAIMNSQLHADEKIANEHILCDNIWDGWSEDGKFSCEELILRALSKVPLPKDTEVLYSSVERQITYGCAIFALKDAVEYLKDPEFFKKLKTSETLSQLPAGQKIRRIDRLPAAFMKGTQSISRLNKYLTQSHPAELILPSKPGKQKTLHACLKDNIVKVDGREQNHYITRKMFKYNRMAVQVLDQLSSDEIAEIYKQTLVQ